MVKDWYKTLNWLRRNSILSGGTFYIEPPCRSMADRQTVGLTDSQRKSEEQRDRDIRVPYR